MVTSFDVEASSSPYGDYRRNWQEGILLTQFFFTPLHLQKNSIMSRVYNIWVLSTELYMSCNSLQWYIRHDLTLKVSFPACAFWMTIPKSQLCTAKRASDKLTWHGFLVKLPLLETYYQRGLAWSQNFGLYEPYHWF